MGLNILSELIDPIAMLIGKVIPDKDKAKLLAHEISTMAENHLHETNLAQLDVAKAEAGHRSMFVAGARPMILWICGAGLCYNVLVYPIADIWFDMPPISLELLYPTLMGMLGLSGMRSADKYKGVGTNNL